jgi:superfamily I DNA/RNA helicase
MRWMVPERRLDESQLAILRECGTWRGANDWIQGFAGSGKTVLLVHLVGRILAQHANASLCVATYTHALRDLIETGFEDEFRGRVPVLTYHQLLNGSRRYDVVLLDEVQDIPQADLTRIRDLAGRLVVAGDTDQSIYERGSTPEQLQRVLEPRPHPLAVIHRLTQRLKDIVQTILPDSQIEAAPTGRMQDVQVTLAHAETANQETEWVWEQCKRYSKQGDPAVVLLPTHKRIQHFIRRICALEDKSAPEFPLREPNGKGVDYDPVNEFLRQESIPLRYLGNSFGRLLESDHRPLTYVMTYHSAKGLDFDTVIIPELNEGTWFWKDEDIARRLFFVACSRSRRNLFMSYSSGRPHEYVQAMPQGLLKKTTCTVLRKPNEDNEIFF